MRAIHSRYIFFRIAIIFLLLYNEKNISERSDIKMNRKKGLLIALPIVIIVCIAAGAFCFRSVENGIDNVADYENIFQSVAELKFYKNENNFYSTQSPAKDLKTLKKINLAAAPLDDNRSKDRDTAYKIVVNGKYIICFNNDFTHLWLDDTQHIDIEYNGNEWQSEADEGILPSFTYSVENPDLLTELFAQHSQHIN